MHVRKYAKLPTHHLERDYRRDGIKITRHVMMYHAIMCVKNQSGPEQKGSGSTWVYILRSSCGS